MHLYSVQSVEIIKSVLNLVVGFLWEETQSLCCSFSPEHQVETNMNLFP